MKKSIVQLARPNIASLMPYQSARNTNAMAQIMLDANENPYTMTKNENLNRYPEPQPKALAVKLSNILNVEEDQILITRGADEGVDLLIRSFCEPTYNKIVVCPPTYDWYEVCAQINNVDVVKVPLNTNSFNLDLDKITDTVDETVKAIFICSPNNPTGNLIDEQNIIALCKRYANDSIIVVDEAYIEFTKQQSMVRYLKLYPNLVVLRTLSKAYGLAGVRCGMVLGVPEVINLLKKIIAPYPIPRPIADFLVETIDDCYMDGVNKAIAKINTEKQKLAQSLSKLDNVVRIWPSDTNFLLVQLKASSRLIQKLVREGIMIRDRSTSLNLKDCVRISIGTELENRRLLEVFQNDET